jgi:hypothetical protein
MKSQEKFIFFKYLLTNRIYGTIIKIAIEDTQMKQLSIKGIQKG